MDDDAIDSYLGAVQGDSFIHFIHWIHLYSASSSGTTQKRSLVLLTYAK